MSGANENSEAVTAIKWDKPKILLIDLPEAVSAAFKQAGYNSQSGTFGTPYSVQMDGECHQLQIAASLPNYEEQEIIVIDLTMPTPIEAPEGKILSSPDQWNWWVQHSESTVDPRPYVMLHASSAFDRILRHGGVIVVLAMPRASNNFVYARRSKYRELEIKQPIKCDNWSFSSILAPEEVSVQSQSGIELSIADPPGPFLEFLQNHLFSMTYDATLELKYSTSQGYELHPLLKTKFGKTASAILVHPDRRGFIAVLPQCRDLYKSRVVFDFVHKVLTVTSPHLFPHAEGGVWIHAPEYEHVSVLHLLREQERIRGAIRSTNR